MTRQWTPEDVLTLARGFQPACVLFAAVELDVFSLLAERPLDVPFIAAKLGTDIRATATLLDALVALDLLRKHDDEYVVPPNVVHLLTESGSDSVLAMTRHQANCLRRWSQLARVVRTGTPADRTPSIRGADADQAAFIEAMDNLSRRTAPRLVAELGPLSFRRLLDIGGASGTWTIALLRAVPGSTATLFDLPEVIPMARKHMAEAGLADRVTFAPGDFYTDTLPVGADLAWLSAIVHQNSRQQNRDLFAKIRAALADGGRLIIRDVIMDDSRTQPRDGALFAINMLVATEGGGTFTLSELHDDLIASGFRDVTLLRRSDWMDSFLLAT